MKLTIIFNPAFYTGIPGKYIAQVSADMSWWTFVSFAIDMLLTAIIGIVFVDTEQKTTLTQTEVDLVKNP